MAKINPIHLQKFLKGLEYPATRDSIVSHAEKHDADDEALDALRGIEEKEYETPAAISKAIGHENEDNE